MHIHVDKMRGNNAWETVKIKKTIEKHIVIML